MIIYVVNSNKILLLKKYFMEMALHNNAAWRNGTLNYDAQW